jgi:hypothetical protein
LAYLHGWPFYEFPLLYNILLVTRYVALLNPFYSIFICVMVNCQNFFWGLLWWSPHLSFKLGDSGSIFARTSTQALKITEAKELPFIDISEWLDFRVFSDKDVKIIGISDRIPYQLGTACCVGNPLTNEWEIQ